MQDLLQEVTPEIQARPQKGLLKAQSFYFAQQFLHKILQAYHPALGIRRDFDGGHRRDMPDGVLGVTVFKNRLRGD